MKFSTVLILFFSCTTIFAQQIQISEAPRAKENSTYNSFLFELPDVDKKQAEKDWGKFMKDFKSKTKYNKKSKLYFSNDAKLPRLSDGAVDVHARILEDNNPKKTTTVIVWFQTGNSYINSEMDSLKGAYARTILTEYAMTTSKHHAESVVKAEENKLKDLEKELKKLEKANKDYRKEITKARETISKNEKNIQTNELNQKNTAKTIEMQKKAIQEAKASVKKFIL